MSKSPLERTAGIVLCGGHSSRMGAPKHLLPFGGQTMLQVVVETLRPVVSPVVVVRSAGQDLPELPADVLITEDEKPDLGPLAGLCAGMAALVEAPLGRDSVFTASCDAPLLKPDVVRYLIGSRGKHDIAAVRDGEFCHAVAAVYSARLLPRIREMLRERRLRLQSLIEASDARFVEAGEIRRFDPDLHSFRNANTPQEYAALLQIAGLPSDAALCDHLPTDSAAKTPCQTFF